MNESEHNPLKEKSWRRKLTPAEAAELEAWLTDHPETRADWEAELRLSEAMSCLPDAPVSSNFTARVLKAIESEAAAESRRRAPRRKWSLHFLLPRAAVAALVLSAGFLTYHEHTLVKHKTELARTIKIVASVPPVRPEILQDFDTILKMGSTSGGPDRELLALMK